MSNNLATVQQMFVSFGQGDIPAILNKLADDVTFVNQSNSPIGGTFHGKSGALDYFQRLGSGSETTGIAPSNFREMGSQLLHDVRHEGVVRATGKSFSQDMVFTWTFNDDGKVTNWVASGDFSSLENAYQN